MTNHLPDKIEELLHRRNDLSTFLVHFTRDLDAGNARANLQSMLMSRTIEARSVLRIMRAHTHGNQALEDSQKVVCFTETPLEHSWMMLRPTDPPRGVQLAPYGLAFPKVWGRRLAVNPIWYVDMTPGGQGVWRDWLINHLDQLRDSAIAGYAVRPDGRGSWATVPVQDSPVARIAPFVEQMVPAGTNVPRKEFSWEREWRHRGDLVFRWENVVAVLAPEDDHDGFRAALVAAEAKLAAQAGRAPEDIPRVRFLDPRWGLERMIARLAGISDADAGPLP